jgi:hypothetical protein
MQRQAQHVCHPDADRCIVERIYVGYLDPERQLKHRLIHRLLHQLGHFRGPLPFWYDGRDASRYTIQHPVGLSAWAEAPGRAWRRCDASCLGKEAWWDILALTGVTQSTVVPERAAWAGHLG